jgi:uncharacterized Zn-binding protein involved in type VI secretion
VAPAARIGDIHVCAAAAGAPAGPIITGCVTVLIGGMPAARVTDQLTCVGPPDMIVMGSPTVITGGMLQARIGDPTEFGGVIATGCVTVIVGP